MLRRDHVLARDPTVTLDHHRPDDRFLPLQSAELVAALAADTERFGPDAAELTAVAAALEDVISQETSTFERALADRYAAFNPDRDTLVLGDLALARTPAAYADLEAQLAYLLHKANFEQLSHVQIEAAVHAANSYGLRVRLHPDRVQHLSVWVRGQTELERCRRTWRRPRRGEVRRLKVYRRLVVVARLRDDPNVLLKIFKEIPVDDVEALLPHAEVQMSWSDRLKMMGGGAGMVGTTAGKIIELASGALVLGKLLWVLMLGAGLLVFRTFMGYRNVRARRDLQRTTSLYYQNLGNNAATIHTLISMVAQEELKEALLTYAFGHARTPALASPADLAARIETYVAARFGVRFDFDVTDALQALTRLDLWTDPARFQVVPPLMAVEQLRRHWQERRSRHHHEALAAQCLPR